MSHDFFSFPGMFFPGQTRVFKEELGDLKGTQAKIHVNPEAQSITTQHSPIKAHTVPFALKTKVEQNWSIWREKGSSLLSNSRTVLHR